MSKILRRQADFFNTIIDTSLNNRPIPVYFRVSFNGSLLFATNIRNRTFVFRSSILFDTIASFAERIGSEWPDAIVITSSAAINDDDVDNNNSTKSSMFKFIFI